MWVFGRPNWCPHNAPAARITISHSFTDFRAKEAKRETARSLLLIGTWGPFKRYTVSTIGYGFANMFRTQFPRCGNPRANGIIVLPFLQGKIQSWVGAGGTRASPLVLDQTEARRAEKIFFWDRSPLISGSAWLPPSPPPYLKLWILQRVVHHKSLKGCILKSLLLLYCFWDILSENRHKEPGSRLRRIRMSQSGIRTSMFCMWKKLNRTVIRPLFFYLIVARILCINP